MSHPFAHIQEVIKTMTKQERREAAVKEVKQQYEEKTDRHQGKDKGSYK